MRRAHGSRGFSDIGAEDVPPEYDAAGRDAPRDDGPPDRANDDDGDMDLVREDATLQRCASRRARRPSRRRLAPFAAWGPATQGIFHPPPLAEYIRPGRLMMSRRTEHELRRAQETPPTSTPTGLTDLRQPSALSSGVRGQGVVSHFRRLRRRLLHDLRRRAACSPASLLRGGAWPPCRESRRDHPRWPFHIDVADVCLSSDGNHHLHQARTGESPRKNTAQREWRRFRGAIAKELKSVRQVGAVTAFLLEIAKEVCASAPEPDHDQQLLCCGGRQPTTGRALRRGGAPTGGDRARRHSSPRFRWHCKRWPFSGTERASAMLRRRSCEGGPRNEGSRSSPSSFWATWSRWAS